MRNIKSLVYSFITGFTVFIVGVYFVLNFTPKQPEPKPDYSYIVTTKDIKKNDVIKEEDLEIKKSQFEISDTYKNKNDLVGKTAQQDIAVGKPIIKHFIKEMTKQINTAQEPSAGFRAIPLLIKKSSMPPYLEIGQKFDLYTKEESMKIENVKILNILDPTTNDSNKMLILEINNADAPYFIEQIVKTKGVLLLQKNIEEYGNYKFTRLTNGNPEPEPKKSTPTKSSVDEYIPPISELLNNNGNTENKFTEEVQNEKKQVELIVGNTKTQVEFNE